MGVSSYQLAGVDCMPTTCSIMLQWWLPMDHSGSIYTIEIGKHYRSVHPSSVYISNLSPVYHPSLSLSLSLLRRCASSGTSISHLSVSLSSNYVSVICLSIHLSITYIYLSIYPASQPASHLCLLYPLPPWVIHSGSCL